MMTKYSDRNLTVPLDGGGCVAKVEPSELARILSFFPIERHPNVLSDLHGFDDASIYQIDDESALLLNVDYIAPVVANPYAFGQIAVANALSDIYAKGVRPLVAMNILGYPAGSHAPSIIELILRGGYDKAGEANVPIIGGHTLNSGSLFYGLACVGITQLDTIVYNHGARPGDNIVLTKPLGSGVIATAAAELDSVSPDLLERAIQYMCTLNSAASAAMHEVGVNAATDVSGFSLIGHMCELVDASLVGARINTSAIPMIEGALEQAASGYPFCSIQRNLTHYQHRVDIATLVSTGLQRLLFDSQTSGGLLIVVSADRTDQLLQELSKRKVADAAVIGVVIERPGAGQPVIYLE